MDIITQRFIELSHRITTTLRGLRSDVKQLVDATREGNQAHEEQDSPPPEVRAILNAPQGVETRKGAADAETDQRHHRQILLVQRVLCFATIGAFAAASYYACYAKKQWDTLNQTYGEIQKQTPKIAEAAGAAIQANIDARERFRQDQRPYIWLTNDLGHPSFLLRPEWKQEEGGYVVWDWHYTNYGRSPAYNIKFRQGMIIGDKAAERERVYGPLIIGAPCPPTKDDWDTVFFKDKISPQRFKQLMDTEDAIVIFAKITYTDSFGGKYETGICLSHLRSGAITYCKEGDYIK